MNASQYFPLIIGCVLLNTVSQMLLKAGMNAIGPFAFTTQNVVPVGFKIVTNPYIISGLACYVLSFTGWLLALSRFDVSVAYPLSSMGYVFTAIAGHYFLHENLSLTRVLGVGIIMIGVYLVSRS